jgi:hypothetical protein
MEDVMHPLAGSFRFGRAWRRLGAGIGSIAIVSAIMMGAAVAPAYAQDRTFRVSLACGESQDFSLGGNAASDGSNDWNVVALPKSSDPSVARGSGSVGNPRSKGTKRPGGTNGGITITAGHKDGLNTTVISYAVEDFGGTVVTIDVVVTVDCRKPKIPTGGGPGVVPPPDPPPPPPPEKQDPKVEKQQSNWITLAHNRIPTHRQTGCAACRPIAAALNAVIDKIAGEMEVTPAGYLRGPESAAADYQEYARLLAELNDCEKACRVPATVVRTEERPVDRKRSADEERRPVGEKPPVETRKPSEQRTERVTEKSPNNRRDKVPSKPRAPENASNLRPAHPQPASTLRPSRTEQAGTERMRAAEPVGGIRSQPMRGVGSLGGMRAGSMHGFGSFGSMRMGGFRLR